MAMIMQRSRKNVRLSEVSDYRAEKQISRVPNFFLQYLWFLFTDFNSSLKIFFAHTQIFGRVTHRTSRLMQSLSLLSHKQHARHVFSHVDNVLVEIASEVNQPLFRFVRAADVWRDTVLHGRPYLIVNSVEKWAVRTPQIQRNSPTSVYAAVQHLHDHDVQMNLLSC